MMDSTQSFTVMSKTSLELLVLWNDVKFHRLNDRLIYGFIS